MHKMSLEQAVEIGLRFHRNGQFREAEEIYQQILRHDPRNADAMHLMGVLAQQANESAVAVEMIRRAIQSNPEVAVFHFNLSEAYRALKKFPDAETALRRTVALAPDYRDAHNNLGLVLLELRRAPEAEAACREALDIDPEFAVGWNNLGNTLRLQERYPEAIAAYQEAIRLSGDFAEAWNNLGICQGRAGDIPAAVESLRTALRHKPELADVHNNLGVMYYRIGRPVEASRALTTAVRLRPGYAEAKINLAAALREAGKADQAVKLCLDALQDQPDSPEAHTNLALSYKDTGALDEAMAQADKALALRPDFVDALVAKAMIAKELKQSTQARELLERTLALRPSHALALTCLGLIDIEQGDAQAAYDHSKRSLELHPDLQTFSNVLLSVNYLPDVSPARVAAEHFTWGRVAEEMMKDLRPARRPRPTGGRKLRVGYASPDFKAHPVAYFIQSFLRHHDAEAFEIYGYAHLVRPDSMTLHLQTLIPHWRFTSGVPVAGILEMIQADEIDILVDLAGHTGNGSLPIFAARPAPVQVSMVGYPNTTGLRTVDYRITDARLDPPGQTESFSSETLHRMPESFWCYTPDDHAPEVADHAPDPRAIRFCSMNNPAKVNAEVVAAWAEILRRVPGSTLMIQGGGMHEARAHERISRQFTAAGVDVARVDFRSSTQLREYYERMSACDIALDPFPYNGGTTTCHKLWMGVPVVAFAGPTHVSRMGYSILNGVGLGDLCGQDVADYVEIAVRLAQDVDRLRLLRTTMRERLRASPLLDEQGYTTHLENAYRSFCGV